MTDDSLSDAVVFRDSVGKAVRFTYRHSIALVAISFAWFVAAIPLVTLGPATLGAYSAVVGLRERGSVNVGAVIGTVRRQLGHAILLGLLPIAFWSVALFYAVQYSLLAEPLTLALFLAAFYIGTYLAIVQVPAFVALAHGERGYDAISFGRSWVSSHTTLALLSVIVTGVFAVATLFLTIAFPFLFAGVAASFHVELVEEAYAEWGFEDAGLADEPDSGVPEPAA